MLDLLILIAVILGVAWLVDRAWAARENRPRGEKHPPLSDQGTGGDSAPDHQRSELRSDWLRLGRRSKR